jgi:hypothetical protein
MCQFESTNIALNLLVYGQVAAPDNAAQMGNLKYNGTN